MSKNQIKAVTMLLTMIVEADKFHLEVAKALLSSEPISEQQRQLLLSVLARRESRHEQQELLAAQLTQLLQDE